MLPTHVRVQEGEIRGVQRKETLSGKPYYGYRGIPYAKPPVGDLRFRPPVPVEKWEGSLVPTQFDTACLQVNKPQFGTDEPVGCEDCLYLNVYTPEAPCWLMRKKPVMVYIHGGGFYQGSGSSLGVGFLLEHDVVLVTFNYRLHVFGFLNVGLPSCPGNVGLKDQLLVLKWVKRNIRFFGGDPDNITLFGESAGAVSAHLHTLSPLSKGLFHKVILQSGNALSPWAVEKDPVYHARRLGQRLGYEGDDLEGLVEYLKNQSAEELCRVADEIHTEDKENRPGYCANVFFIPSVEEIKEGAFLPECPKKLMESAAAIPAVIGFNDREGLLYYMAQQPHCMSLVLDDLSLVVKQNFNLNALEQEELLAEIRSFYFGSYERSYDQKLGRTIDLYGDLYFMKFYEAFDHLIRSNVSSFVYLFAYDGGRNYFKQELVTPYVEKPIEGAAHADELGYLFDSCEPANEADEKMILQLCTLWTNFAKSGHPTCSLPQVDWRAFTHESPSYLKIDKELTVFDKKLYEKRFSFWKKWSSKFIR